MPSVSWKQHKLMTAVEHSPAFAKKVGIPQSVGRDFAKADNKAGITKKPDKKRKKHKLDPHNMTHSDFMKL